MTSVGASAPARWVVAVVEGRGRVERALAELRSVGFGSGAVRVVDDPEQAYVQTPESGAEILAGQVGGLTIGGLVGAAAGWVADAVELAAVETVEALVTAGPLEPILDRVDPMVAAGAGVGALAGALLGVHAGWAILEDRARANRGAVERGGVMIRIRVADRARARLARSILRGLGATGIRCGVAVE